MNTFPRYDSYKDSDVDWLGEIPEHWKVKRLKYLLNERNERSETGNEPLFMVSQTHGLVVRADHHEKADVAQSNVGNKKVHKNDLVFNKLKAHLGVFYKSNIDFVGIVSPDYAVYYPIGEIEDLKFLELLFRHPAYIAQFISKATGIVEGLIRLYTSDLFSLEVPVPPVDEQTVMINFLESKTTQIDQAIAQKERLIELLKERRQLLIHKAVTRGLNPNVKLKHSGVDWLGEIPEHWEIRRLRTVIKDLESGVSVNASESESAVNGEIGVLKTSCVYKYFFEPNENKKVFQSDLKRVNCSVKANTIIISRMNAPELVGASGYVSENFQNLFLPDRLWQTVFYKDSGVNVRWLSKVFITLGFRECITAIANGSSPSMKNISKGDFLNLRFALPPIQEQSLILEYIENITAKIETAISCKQKEIEKLKEYKAVLINSAVTGKIKVCGNSQNAEVKSHYAKSNE
jgi:type I restriction enzyme, S subunit